MGAKGIGCGKTERLLIAEDASAGKVWRQRETVSGDVDRVEGAVPVHQVGMIAGPGEAGGLLVAGNLVHSIDLQVAPEGMEGTLGAIPGGTIRREYAGSEEPKEEEEVAGADLLQGQMALGSAALTEEGAPTSRSRPDLGAEIGVQMCQCVGSDRHVQLLHKVGVGLRPVELELRVRDACRTPFGNGE
jgi:hypothetical protein